MQAKINSYWVRWTKADGRTNYSGNTNSNIKNFNNNAFNNTQLPN